MKKKDDPIMDLVVVLHNRFGRFPTEEEVMDFILGSRETRLQIWNQTYEKKESNNGTEQEASEGRA